MAFYRKNIGGPQQILRLALGLGGAAAAYFYLPGWMGLVGVASGLGFAATGLVGYCPMCAMVMPKKPS